jgi:hypothetical protein
MVSRGRLLGVLVLGHKKSGDSYAPDELQAIRHMPHGVASSLDVLEQRANDPVLERLDAMRDALAALPQAIQEANRSWFDELRLRTP